MTHCKNLLAPKLLHNVSFNNLHTLGNIVAGNKVAGNTQCMVMMGPATMLLRIYIGSIQSNIVAGPIMTIHWVFLATLFPATMLPSVCWA